MIKRILKVGTAVLLTVVLLVSCGGLEEFSEPNDRRLVSAMGFDNEDGRIKVTLEAVEPGQEGSVDFSSYLLTGVGIDTQSAMTLMSSKSARELSFTHCSAIIVGKSLNGEQITDILEYCTNEKMISLSARVISADNAGGLLTAETGAVLSPGYEMADMIDRTAKLCGTGGHAALYEINTARLQEQNVYALPFFEAFGELSYSGMEVYVDDIPFTKLDREQSTAYAILRNIFDGGEIVLGNGVHKISWASSKIEAVLDGGRLSVDITVRLQPENRAVLDIVRETVKEFDADIFGVGNAIRVSHPEIWERIEAEYDSYYRAAKITVREE